MEGSLLLEEWLLALEKSSVVVRSSLFAAILRMLSWESIKMDLLLSRAA